MNRKICFVINSHSDSGKTGSFFRKNESFLRGEFPAAKILYVSCLEKLHDELSGAACSYDIIVACGGDGTAQAVAKAVSGAGKIMGLLPYGSGNDFAKSIGLNPDQPLKNYLKVLSGGVISEIDFPVFNQIYFLNTAGIGFDGLSAVYAKKLAPVRGKMKYITAAVAALLRSRTFGAVIKADGKVINGTYRMLTVANGRAEGGGFVISPGSSNTDGLLELILVPAYSKLKLARSLLRLAAGKPLTDTHRRLMRFQQAEIMLSRRQHVHLDGEVLSPLLRAEIKIGLEKVQVLVPAEYLGKSNAACVAD